MQRWQRLGPARRWLASEASAAPAPAGEAAELVEVPLAQTGEGIAECELLRWFVAEVSAGPAAFLAVAPCGIAPWGIWSSYNCGLWSYACRN